MYTNIEYYDFIVERFTIRGEYMQRKNSKFKMWVFGIKVNIWNKKRNSLFNNKIVIANTSSCKLIFDDKNDLYLLKESLEF